MEEKEKRGLERMIFLLILIIVVLHSFMLWGSLEAHSDLLIRTETEYSECREALFMIEAGEFVPLVEYDYRPFKVGELPGSGLE